VLRARSRRKRGGCLKKNASTEQVSTFLAAADCGLRKVWSIFLLRFFIPRVTKPPKTQLKQIEQTIE
jgi:hypothetical protein